MTPRLSAWSQADHFLIGQRQSQEFVRAAMPLAGDEPARPITTASSRYRRAWRRANAYRGWG
jgi:hypothetical protein